MTVKEIITNYNNISLKRVCDTTGLCYQYVLKSSKQPVPGVVYNPTETNWENIEKIVSKKNIDLSKFDWKTINDSVKVYEPLNKPEEFTIGISFKIRKDNETYTTIYTTDTHIVFLPVTGTQPRVMNWDTFIHQSPRIVK